MRLIVITTEAFFNGEAEAINLLFKNGLELLHIRKPYISADEMRSFIEQIDKTFHHNIVLHDNYELANVFGLKGIHLNRRNKDVSGELEKSLSISCSCHSFKEIGEAQKCEYVFLSPVFDSISKVGYKQGFTHEQLCDARDKGIISKHIVALGGVAKEQISVVSRYGFGGVAILGALWNNFIKDGNTDELLRRFNELKIECEEK